MPELQPSLLSANLGMLQHDINTYQDSIDRWHYDVMDGHFVPNLTFGAPVLQCLQSTKPFDVHLMVTNPADRIAEFLAAGAASISFHYETHTHHHRTLDAIREGGALAGIALNPGTSVAAASATIEHADFVLVMSVNPGFSGQAFIESSLNKVRQIRDQYSDKIIQIDGGITLTTAPQAIAAGANWLVSGSAFWGAENPAVFADQFHSL